VRSSAKVISKANAAFSSHIMLGLSSFQSLMRCTPWFADVQQPVQCPVYLRLQVLSQSVCSVTAATAD
jgi:hypothetical protein